MVDILSDVDLIPLVYSWEHKRALAANIASFSLKDQLRVLQLQGELSMTKYTKAQPIHPTTITQEALQQVIVLQQRMLAEGKLTDEDNKLLDLYQRASQLPEERIIRFAFNLSVCIYINIIYVFKDHLGQVGRRLLLLTLLPWETQIKKWKRKLA
jgi:hypothetical protein